MALLNVLASIFTSFNAVSCLVTFLIVFGLINKLTGGVFIGHFD